MGAERLCARHTLGQGVLSGVVTWEARVERPAGFDNAYGSECLWRLSQSRESSSQEAEGTTEIVVGIVDARLSKKRTRDCRGGKLPVGGGGGDCRGVRRSERCRCMS